MRWLEQAAEALPPQAEAAASAALAALLREALAARGARPFGACRTCRHFRREADGPVRHRCGLLDVALSDLESHRLCVEHEWAA